MHDDKETIIARCTNVSSVLKFFLILFTLTLIAATSYFIYCCFEPSQLFHSKSISFGDSSLGLAYMDEAHSSAVVFANLPVDSSIGSPKIAYLLNYFLYKLCANFILLVIVYKAYKIFRLMSSESHLFHSSTVKLVSTIGKLVIAFGLFNHVAIPIILSIFNLDSGNVNLIDVPTLCIGLVILCIAHIFGYVGILQKESDETL